MPRQLFVEQISNKDPQLVTICVRRGQILLNTEPEFSCLCRSTWHFASQQPSEGLEGTGTRPASSSHHSPWQPVARMEHFCSPQSVALPHPRVQRAFVHFLFVSNVEIDHLRWLQQRHIITGRWRRVDGKKNLLRTSLSFCHVERGGGEFSVLTLARPERSWKSSVKIPPGEKLWLRRGFVYIELALCHCLWFS